MYFIKSILNTNIFMLFLLYSSHFITVSMRKPDRQIWETIPSERYYIRGIVHALLISTINLLSYYFGKNFNNLSAVKKTVRTCSHFG